MVLYIDILAVFFTAFCISLVYQSWVYSIEEKEETKITGRTKNTVAFLDYKRSLKVHVCIISTFGTLSIAGNSILYCGDNPLVNHVTLSNAIMMILSFSLFLYSFYAKRAVTC